MYSYALNPITSQWWLADLFRQPLWTGPVLRSSSPHRRLRQEHGTRAVYFAASLSLFPLDRQHSILAGPFLHELRVGYSDDTWPPLLEPRRARHARTGSSHYTRSRTASHTFTLTRAHTHRKALHTNSWYDARCPPRPAYYNRLRRPPAGCHVWRSRALLRRSERNETETGDSRRTRIYMCVCMCVRVLCCH